MRQAWLAADAPTEARCAPFTSEPGLPFPSLSFMRFQILMKIVKANAKSFL